MTPQQYAVRSVTRTTVNALKQSIIASALVLMAATACIASAADFYSGKTFRITGPWDGNQVTGQRIQLRDLETDSNRGQIIGVIEAVDAEARTLTLGPVSVKWSDKTEFKEITLEDLKVGKLIRASGRNGERGILNASTIESGPKDLWPEKQLQITGTVTDAQPLDGGRTKLKLLSIPVDMPRAGYNRVESLTLRQDARRRDMPFTVDLAGRPLRITGEYDFTLRERGNLRLDDSSNRNLRDDQTHEFDLEFFLPYSNDVYFFLEGKAFYEGDIYRSSGTPTDQYSFQRGQSWIFFDGLMRNHIGLQLGRQNVREVREWWWDIDLDAARLYFDEGPFHAELGAGQELARFSTLQTSVDPLNANVRRVFGNASWLWASRQTLELFALNQRDASGHPALGEIIPRERQDSSDADLTWLGVRALGQRSFDEYGAIKYWADWAWLTGKDRVVSFASNGAASSPSERTVNATGFDVGLSWQAKLPLRPALTLGFARGSGDSNVADGQDGNFRQTTLQKNKGRFFGVNRFRYYGELLRPELANLNVATAAMGISFFNNSSAELVYHRYWQSQAASRLRDVRIDASLNGQSRDVGEELDLVLGFRDLNQLDFAITGSVFRAGDGYGTLARKTAYQLIFDVVFFF